MHHRQVAGVEPAAPERLGRGLGPLVVALHHVVAAHDHLAHRLAVGRDVVHLLVDHARLLGDQVADALAGLLARLLLRRQAFHCSCHSQTVCGPYVSVRP